MAKYVKPELLNLVWASDALPADKPSPDSSGEFSGVGITVDVAEGWTQVKPPYEVENWIQNQQSQFNAYINQLGVPEWDTDTEYQTGKSYVQGSDNRIYKCILTHSGRNPASGNPSYWELFEGNRQATTTARGTVELATSAEAQAGTSDSLAVTPSGLRGILEVLFPVDSVVMRPTNPANSIANGGLGFGSWTRISGRTLVGAGSTTDTRGESRSFTNGQTSGEFRHVLTESEMPNHRHQVGAYSGVSAGQFRSEPFEGTSSGSSYSDYTGGDVPHNNMQPYYVVDMWRRTA